MNEAQWNRSRSGSAVFVLQLLQLVSSLPPAEHIDAKIKQNCISLAQSYSKINIHHNLQSFLTYHACISEHIPYSPIFCGMKFS